RHGDRGAQFVTAPEVLLERCPHRREALVAVAVDLWFVLGHGPSVIAGSPGRDAATGASRTYRLVGSGGRCPTRRTRGRTGAPFSQAYDLSQRSLAASW